MAKKSSSMRFSPEQLAFLHRHGRGTTEQLNYDLATLEEILREAQAGPLDFLPPDEALAIFSRLVRRGGAAVAGRFTTPEALAICDAFNSFALDPVAAESADTVLVVEIEDALKLDGLAERHGIDGQALLEKLRALSHPQALAVILWAKRFWSAAGTQDPEAPLPAYDQDARARAAAIFRCADR